MNVTPDSNSRVSKEDSVTKTILAIILLTWWASAAFGYVLLSMFQAVPGNNTVNLHWVSASESNNDHFELWRDSMLVSIVRSQGNGTESHEYHYADDVLNGNTVLYSLYDVDTDGIRSPLDSAYVTPSASSVVLESFEVVPGDNSVGIHWRTAFENYNAMFEIRRDRVLIATVRSQGNGTDFHSYSFTDVGLVNGVTYLFELSAVDSAERIFFLDSARATPNVTSVQETPLCVVASRGLSAYPNPFNATTTIRYEMIESGRAKIEVTNLLGQTVTDCGNNWFSAGSHELLFDGSMFPSGVYFCRFQAGTQFESHKLLLLK
jgi:hypothetical protein